MSRNQTLKEIFFPSLAKVALAVLVAIFAHLFLVVAALRAAGQNIELARHFWATNLINALPYLETDNVVLKFLTFFIISYLIVWVFSKLFTLFDNTQKLIGRRLRRKS